MRKFPLISTVLPVYNGETFIAEAVESILAQDFTDFELIIINDGSTDRSGEILRAFAAKDDRIRLIERPNGGLVSALNQGIELSQAEFVARMDADDIATPDRFRLQYQRMKEDPKLGLLGSFINIIDKEGTIIRLGDYPVPPKDTALFLENGCPLAHPSVMMRKAAVVDAGGYRKVFSHCEDYDLWLRVSELDYDIANYPRALLHYRVHSNNVSIKHREAQEFGTIVARFSHRARIAGLEDPCDGIEAITPELIHAFPEFLRQDLEAAIFVNHHGNISLASTEDIKAAWIEYRALSNQAKRKKIMCDFLMRLFRGGIRKKQYKFALFVISVALYKHPILSIKMLLAKFKSIAMSINWFVWWQ